MRLTSKNIEHFLLFIHNGDISNAPFAWDSIFPLLSIDSCVWNDPRFIDAAVKGGISINQFKERNLDNELNFNQRLFVFCSGTRSKTSLVNCFNKKTRHLATKDKLIEAFSQPGINLLGIEYNSIAMLLSFFSLTIKEAIDVLHFLSLYPRSITISPEILVKLGYKKAYDSELVDAEYGMALTKAHILDIENAVDSLNNQTCDEVVW